MATKLTILELLEELTGIPGWVEVDGPDSGVGLDWWYTASDPERDPVIRYEANRNLDQVYEKITLLKYCDFNGIEELMEESTIYESGAE